MSYEVISDEEARRIIKEGQKKNIPFEWVEDSIEYIDFLEDNGEFENEEEKQAFQDALLLWTAVKGTYDERYNMADVKKIANILLEEKRGELNGL